MPPRARKSSGARAIYSAGINRASSNSNAITCFRLRTRQRPIVSLKAAARREKYCYGCGTRVNPRHSVERMAITEGHARVAIHTCIQRNASVRKLDELQLPALVLSQHHEHVQPRPFGVPLNVFAGRNFLMAHVAGSDQVSDHGDLDA